MTSWNFYSLVMIEWVLTCYWKCCWSFLSCPQQSAVTSPRKVKLCKTCWEALIINDGTWWSEWRCMLEAKHELHRGFVFRSQPPSSSPPSFLLSLSFPVSAVPHIPGLRGGGRPRPQPAVPGHLPELLVLLPQRRGGGEQEAQLLLRHLVRCGRRPHHLVRESATDVPANCRLECAHTRYAAARHCLCFPIFFIGLLVFLTGGFNIRMVSLQR